MRVVKVAVLVCVSRTTTKKGRKLFGEKSATPDKILTTPMLLSKTSASWASGAQLQEDSESQACLLYVQCAESKPRSYLCQVAAGWREVHIMNVLVTAVLDFVNNLNVSLNNLVGTWRRRPICSPDIGNVSALEVLRNRAQLLTKCANHGRHWLIVFCHIAGRVSATELCVLPS